MTALWLPWYSLALICAALAVVAWGVWNEIRERRAEKDDEAGASPRDW